MKSFKSFIAEEVDLAAYVHSGNLDIDDPSVRDSINTFLTGVTSKCFVTPYIAYERVSKVLANFHVHLRRTTFLENDSGMVVLPVSQFGGKVGMRNDGSVVTKDPQPYHVYFEYRRNEKGLYDVFCEVLDDTELDDIMDDLHGEMNDYDDADDDPGSQVMSASDQRKDRLEEGVWKGIKDAFFPTRYTPLNDPNEMEPDEKEPPKKPTKRPVGKKKLSENENDPFRNAKGLYKPSGNPSMHMQDGDKDFTAMYGKGTPSSAGPKVNPNFKPNPAYAKPSSTSNLVFKYDPNNPPRLSTTNPVQKGPITRGKNLLTHLEEESKRKRVKELAARQRERYARQKGDEPPIMSGPSGYSITQTEKDRIRGILKGQKEKRKEAKGAIKAAKAVKRAGAVQTTQPEKPTTVAQPASKPFGASVENLVRAYNHYAGLYGQSGDPSHLDAAKKAARGHYATLISTIAHHPGHPDYESAKGAAKSILDSHLDALSSLEAVTPKKVEPPQKKGLLGRVKDMIKEQESKRLEEMIGKGRLSKKKKKELSQRIDKKMDDEQVKSLGHKFGGEPFNMKDYNKDTEKLVHNKKYMRMSTMKSKLDYPEYFKEEDDHINE